MDRDQVIEILRTIKFPGFNRDIISFGMVQEILIQDDTISVYVNITTKEDDKKQIIIDEIRTKLGNTKAFSQIHVVEQATEPEQQNKKEELVVNGNIGNIIAVASGKGGVGKSTVAVNLAVAISKKGYKVGLLDLDIYGPSLPILLGLNQPPEITSDRKLVPPEYNGMKVMSFGFISGNNAPVIWRGPMVAKMTEQFFQDVIWGDLDYLILDLPPGTGDVQLTLSQKIPMQGAVIVTTPQDLALADVRKGADMFQKVGVPVLGVVENMSGLVLNGRVSDADGNPATGININFEDYGVTVEPDQDGVFNLKIDLFKQGGGKNESLRLGVPLLGEIPVSPAVVQSTDSGSPLVLNQPDSLIGKIFGEIADTVTKE